MKPQWSQYAIQNMIGVTITDMIQNLKAYVSHSWKAS